MQQYIGTKIVQAEPEMSHGDSEGYKVVYEDGYTSWSPRDAFEKAYRVIGENTPLAEKLYDVYGTATNWTRASGEPMSRTLGEIQLNAQAAWQAVADAAIKLATK